MGVTGTLTLDWAQNGSANLSDAELESLPLPTGEIPEGAVADPSGIISVGDPAPIRPNGSEGPYRIEPIIPPITAWKAKGANMDTSTVGPPLTNAVCT